MTDFPKLQPALNLTVEVSVPLMIGSASRGTPMAVVPITGGSCESEVGFEPRLEATFKGIGADYLHNDPTGKHMRLNAHVVLE